MRKNAEKSLGSEKKTEIRRNAENFHVWIAVESVVWWL